METCTRIGIKRKEKKEGRGRGQESSPSPPRSCPLSHHTDDAQQHHSASQQPAAAHTMAPRARAQGPKFRIHTQAVRKVVLVPWPVVPQTKHTDKQRLRRNARVNEERVGKRGAGPQKSRSRAAAIVARALSLILKRTVRRPLESPSRLRVL